MAKFVAKQDIHVKLHDKRNVRFAEAHFRQGVWEAPSEAQAEALRVKLPQLVDYGVAEIEPEPKLADDEKEDQPDA